MKYRIHAEDKSNAAKRVIEVEADSKAAAEKIARAENLIVRRVEDITDGAPKSAIVAGGSKRGSGSSPLVKLAFLVAIIALVWYFLPVIRRKLHI